MADYLMRIDDLIIAVAYFSIPLQLVASLTYYPRLMQMPPKILAVVILFALFVWCCGFGHFLRAGGYTNKKVFEVVNWITAAVSLTTAAVLLPMVPTMMSELDEGLARLQRVEEEVARGEVRMDGGGASSMKSKQLLPMDNNTGTTRGEPDSTLMTV